MNIKFKRILFALIGVILTGVSVGIIQKSNLGTDPFSSFTTGLSNATNISFGIFYTIICAIILIGVFILDKHYIGLATILNLFLIGIIADTTRETLEKIITTDSYIVRIIILIGGIVIMCFSASLYFTADLGISAYDSVSKIMSDKIKMKFKICRITTDLICVVIGVIFKANVGIGTVITAFFMGPLISYFNVKFSEPILNNKKYENINSSKL